MSSHSGETIRTEQNRAGQNRTEQNRTEQNRTEQNRTEQNRTVYGQRTVKTETELQKQRQTGNPKIISEKPNSTCVMKEAYLNRLLLLFYGFVHS